MALACVLFDWGDTLMSEDGPAETPMALWPEVRAIDGAEVVLRILAARYRIAVATSRRKRPRISPVRAVQLRAVRRWFDLAPRAPRDGASPTRTGDLLGAMQALSAG